MEIRIKEGRWGGRGRMENGGSALDSCGRKLLLNYGNLLHFLGVNYDFHQSNRVIPAKLCSDITPFCQIRSKHKVF